VGQLVGATGFKERNLFCKVRVVRAPAPPCPRSLAPTEVVLPNGSRMDVPHRPLSLPLSLRPVTSQSRESSQRCWARGPWGHAPMMGGAISTPLLCRVDACGCPSTPDDHSPRLPCGRLTVAAFVFSGAPR